jgi:hypothetical protein
MNRKTESAIRKAAKGSRDETTATCGTSCYFVGLDDDYGVKLYATALERDAAYVAQSVGHEVSIGPETGDCFEIENLELHPRYIPYWWYDRTERPRKMYGYITECVEIIEDHSIYDYRDFDLLKSIAKEFGFDIISDVRESNVGVDKRGELVILDWDARFTVSGLLSPLELDTVSSYYSCGSLWDRPI